ncbi:aurora kinase A- and ninein-interacting protein isoform X2 [Struthio camelus]
MSRPWCAGYNDMQPPNQGRAKAERGPAGAPGCTTPSTAAAHEDKSLISRPKVSHRLLQRRCDGYTSVSFTQAGAAPSRTKQTTLSAFFSTQKGEKDKGNSRSSPLILNKEHKGIPLAASPVKTLTFPLIEEAQKQPCRAEEKKIQIIPQHLVQKALALQTFLPDSSVLETESHSKSEASCGVKDDFFLDFTQDSEGNRILAHRNAADLRAGETVSASNITSGKTAASWINKEESQLDPEEKDGLDFQPRRGANQSKKPHQLPSSDHSLIDFSEPENVNPAITRDNIWAAGLYSSPKRTTKAQPLRECGQITGGGSAKEEWDRKTRLSSPLKQLFTQDSEGNRVISHYCQKVRSPLKDKNSMSSRLTNSPYKDCSRDTTNRNISKLEEPPQLEACYDLLFTQDSEGNRVIKH